MRRAHLAGSVLDVAGSIDTAGGELFGTTDAHMPGYHVVLGTRGLVVSRGGYQRSLQQKHAAQIATTGLNSASRIQDQVIVITGWGGGEGTRRHQPANQSRYRRGSNIDIFSDNGAVGLGPRMVIEEATAFDELTIAEVFEGKLYVGTGTGLLYSLTTGGTWTLHHTTGKAGGIRSIVNGATPGDTRSWLRYGSGTDGIIFQTDGTTPATYTTVPGTAGGTVSGIYALVSHFRDGQIYQYYGMSGSNFGLFGVFDAVPPSGDGLGTIERRVAVAIRFEAKIYALANDTQGRRARIYSIDDDDAGFGRPDTEWYQEGSNFTAACVHDGFLYIGDAFDGRIWRWNGNELELYHQIGTTENPYTAEIKGMASYQGGLWISIVDTDGTIGLLRDNGTEDWTRPVTGLLGTTPGFLVEFDGDLFLATNATGAARLYRTDGTFTASGSIEQAQIDAELGNAPKLWHDVAIQTSALLSGQSVQVQYRLEDTGAWTSLGTLSTVGATSTTFPFPNGTLGGLLSVRMLLTGTDGATSQLLVTELQIGYSPSKGALREWRLTVDLFGHDGSAADEALRMVLVGGAEEPLTGEELSADLWALLERQVPLLFYDRDRAAPSMVLMTEYSETDGQSMPNLGAMAAGYDLNGQLTLKGV